MRILGLAALVLVAGCAAAPPPDPNAFEVDAKGAPAVVDQTLTPDGLGLPLADVSACIWPTTAPMADTVRRTS